MDQFTIMFFPVNVTVELSIYVIFTLLIFIYEASYEV